MKIDIERIIFLVLLLLVLFAAVAVGHAPAPPNGAAPGVSIRPLSHLPHKPSVGYYLRHIQDNVGTFEVVADIVGTPPVGGELLPFTLSGLATSSDYSLDQTSPVILSPGQTEIVFVFTIENHGKFFRERFIDLQLGTPTGLEIVDGIDRVKIGIRPSVDPPTISFVQPAGMQTAGSTFLVDVQLSAPSLEDVVLNYTLGGTINPEHVSSSSGTFRILAGQTLGSIWVTLDSQATGRLEIALDYERNTVAYLLTDGREVHVDENLWTEEGVVDLEDGSAVPPIPGEPSAKATGGAVSPPGSPMQAVEQESANPVINPWTQLPQKGFAQMRVTPNTSGVGYLRESFADQYCSGPESLHQFLPWVRVSMYVELFNPDEPRFKSAEFCKLNFRNRKKDLDHTVTFYRNSTGYDHQGQPVEVVQTGSGNWGLWDTHYTHPLDSWGIIEEDHGGRAITRLWYIHFLDRTYYYTYWNENLQMWELRCDYPGYDDSDPDYEDSYDFGNFIAYPLWYGADGSAGITGGIQGNMETGLLAHGFQFEMSELPLEGPPPRHWPKYGLWWEPAGGAVIDPSNLNIHTVGIR